MTDNTKFYPTPNELRDVLRDSVRHTELLNFMRSKGVFFLNASHEDAASLASRHVFDGKGIEQLRKYAYRATHKSILSGFTMVSDSFFDLESVYNTIREKEVLKKDGYKLNYLYNTGSKKYGGSVVFTKRKPGRNAFLRYEERTINFTMETLSDKLWQVETDGENSTDGKVIQQMFATAVRGKEIKVDEIMFDNLPDASKIVFFDRLAKEGLGSEWSIVDVLRLTLKKPKAQKESSEEEEEDVATAERGTEKEEVKEATQEQLSGIAQAILEGKNLRENKFVHMAEEGGYIFSSMTYLFERSKDGSHLKLRAEFKGNPRIFEVCLEGYSKADMEAEDDVVAGLSDEENYEYRSAFWNSAKRIYSELTTKKV